MRTEKPRKNYYTEFHMLKELLVIETAVLYIEVTVTREKMTRNFALMRCFRSKGLRV